MNESGSNPVASIIQLQVNGTGKADGKPGVVRVPKRSLRKMRHDGNDDDSVAFLLPVSLLLAELPTLPALIFATIGLKMAGQRLRGVRETAPLPVWLDTAVTGAAPAVMIQTELKMMKTNNMSERRELLPPRECFMAAPIDKRVQLDSWCLDGHRPIRASEKVRRFRIRLCESTAMTVQSAVIQSPDDSDAICHQLIGRFFIHSTVA